eukprot:4271342-Pyramimonas_sp.AAC.1
MVTQSICGSLGSYGVRNFRGPPADRQMHSSRCLLDTIPSHVPSSDVPGGVPFLCGQRDA